MQEPPFPATAAEATSLLAGIFRYRPRTAQHAARTVLLQAVVSCPGSVAAGHPR
ncbi:MAG TPA: hypothetical protein VNL74_13000 [Methylococcus sp.]|nr:hypothetical protein [Methylococcus sp.]